MLGQRGELRLKCLDGGLLLDIVTSDDEGGAASSASTRREGNGSAAAEVPSARTIARLFHKPSPAVVPQILSVWYGPHFPQQERRNKLGIKLAEQIEIAEAELAGETFERMKRACVTDENGDRKKVERPARLKKCWVKDNAGNIILRVLYGSRAVELRKGLAAVEVGQLDKLPAILKTIKDAVAAGELDAEIGLIAKERMPKKKLKAA